jgi:hypothetical protein
MPHVDELLGPVTLAAAGLFAAIALQPALPATSPARAAAVADRAPHPTVAARTPMPDRHSQESRS